jgi:hypothetical protein
MFSFFHLIEQITIKTPNHKCPLYWRLKEKYADFENVCAKPLRLIKKYADFENVSAKPLRLMKK